MNKFNILYILSDDQRFDTINALGNPHIHTPNLDSLVNKGFAFQRNFCTTPICTPARAEILTGCTSFVNGVPWFGMPINSKLVLLPEAFHAAGYHTIHVGKWHNDGHPRDKGYDVASCVFNNDNLNDYQTHGHYMRFKEPDGEVFGHSTDLFTNAAIKALHSAPKNKPWFCYLAYHAPHDPHECPEPFSSMYDPSVMPLYQNYMPEHPFDNGDMFIRDELVENWPRSHDAMRRYRARYYGMISHMDHAIGQLLGALKASGELENTIIVFTGDQGIANGSHGLLGKENMYDHSIASPLIFCGPGIPAGGRTQAMSRHVDLYPTLCELAGIQKPATAMHGDSLVPVFSGIKERVCDAVLSIFYSPEYFGGELRHTQRAIRTERWKMIWYPNTERYQLFDLCNDPYEISDLLISWRKRQRELSESDLPLWKKDPWAAIDTHVHYTQQEITKITGILCKKMAEEMVLHEDPLCEQKLPNFTSN